MTAKKTKSNSAILKKEAEISDLKDKYLRLIAEFENYKKRTAKEKEDFAKYAKENLINSILPIIDDFERAKKTKEKDVQGYILIGQKMTDILEKQNLKKIELTENELFDLEKHEAISSIQVKEKNKKGRIIEEVEPGYMLLDKIIRYPKVIIGK
ncbi:MAG: nucleotide exchange factor GrpE [Flavobacteriales bacterium]|jgi:molecular chaperone GrpE|nr:nucleotide exchange factor GrpE [Flavobacteriales bacterium]|tara:strand:+ start:670 stop:1131 length:462 start_codon:yes stop_codon:yes gene_type:complete